MKNRGVVHISFTRPLDLIRSGRGLAAFAIGFELLLVVPARSHGLHAAKDLSE